MPSCPICRLPVLPEAKAFPFCSERCRLLDLGNWLDERYIVPVVEDDDGTTNSSSPGSDDAVDYEDQSGEARSEDRALARRPARQVQ